MAQTIQTHRDKLLTTLRQHHHNKALRQHRQNLHTQFQPSQQQMDKRFKEIYPVINEENYREYKCELADMAVLGEFGYRIAVFGGVVYGYLLGDGGDGYGGCYRSDADSWKILQCISQYQQAYIPLTQQLAQLLIEPLTTPISQPTLLGPVTPTFPLLQPAPPPLIPTLITTSNLLQIPKYHSILKAHLLDHAYIDRIGNLVSCPELYVSTAGDGETVMELFVEILCCFVGNCPVLGIEDVRRCLRVIGVVYRKYRTENMVYNIMLMFMNIRQKIKPNKQYAQALIQQLDDFITQERYGMQIYISDLLYYCARSQVWIPWNKILNILDSCISQLLSTPTNHQPLTQTLQCLQLYIQTTPQDPPQQLYHQLVPKLLNIYSKHHSNKPLNQAVLRILAQVDDGVLVDGLVESGAVVDVVLGVVEGLGERDWAEVAVKVLGRVVRWQVEMEEESAVGVNLVRVAQSLGATKALQYIYNQPGVDRQFDNWQELLWLLDVFTRESQ